MRRTARSVVPNAHVLHEGDARRFRHVDLAELSEGQLWAERVMVEHELARLIFTESRPRFLDPEQSDQDWLAARSGRLRDELSKRRAGKGRHAA